MMIREALACDAQAIARVQIASWRATYSGIIDPTVLAAMSQERITRGWLHWFFDHPTHSRCQVATTDAPQPGRVIGFVMGGPARDAPPAGTRAGEVQVLYMHPDYQRDGVGRKLLSRAARGLAQAGFESMQIWCLRDNPCRAFYEQLGGQIVHTRQTRVAGQRLTEVCFAWPSLRALALAGNGSGHVSGESKGSTQWI